MTTTAPTTGTTTGTATTGTATTGTAGAPSRRAIVAGRVLTALLTAFFLFDAVAKLLLVPDVVAASGQLGFAPHALPVIGATLLVCVALHLVPRTALLGAVLLTGYLGGAVAAQLRVDAPVFSALLFPVYCGVVVWAALYLRDARVRAVVADLLGR
jgi:hypothetical protein